MPANLTISCECYNCGKQATYVLTRRDSTSYKCSCRCHAK